MDYFDCDYFDQTYFDTPDCGTPVVSAGHHAVRVITTVPKLPDDDDELLAII